MAYKKYIQRNGKLYGPYIYQSKRVDGKVVSEYYGSEGIKKNEVIKRSDGIKKRDYNYKKIFLVFLGIVLLGVLVYFIASSNHNQNSKLTGGAILGVDTSYTKGQPLDGVLRFSVSEGELIPESSKIVFENAGNTYEFQLNEIFKETPSEGNYYVEGKNISGSGLGYGLEGQKTIYPDLGFTLQVYNEAIGGETTDENIPVEVTQESSNETTPEDIPAEYHVEANSSTPITGGVVKNSGGFLSSIFNPSGRVTMELQKEVNGITSKNNPFVYNLQSGETAELKLKSVDLNGQELADNVISLNIADDKATVTTEYSETEKGYGKDYIGEKKKTLSLDLTALNLSLEEGDLNIKLVYKNEEILQLTTSLKEGETNLGEIVEEPVSPNVSEENQTPEEIPVEPPIEANITNQTVQEIVNSSIWDIGDFLTPPERKILADNFGNMSLKKVKSETFNGKIIMSYEFGGYYVEYSYDSSLNKDILNVQMEKDRIKFLKDIAGSVEKKNSETSPQVLEGYNETYAP
jgi:hypothetical protein